LAHHNCDCTWVARREIKQNDVRSEKAGGRHTVEMVSSAARHDGDGDRVPHPFHGDVEGLPCAEPRPRIARIKHVHLDGAVYNGGAHAQLPSVRGTIAPCGSRRGVEGAARACSVGAGRAGERAQNETCRCPVRAVSRHSDSRTSDGTCSRAAHWWGNGRRGLGARAGANLWCLPHVDHRAETVCARCARGVELHPRVTGPSG
jgi:hypothetical protein